MRTRHYESFIEHPTKPFVVVCFGMLGYRILAEFDTEAKAEQELEWLRSNPEAMKDAARGYTSKPVKDDFDVRTPEDLDALTKAILSTYR